MGQYLTNPSTISDILNIIRILCYIVSCAVFLYKFIYLVKHRWIFLLLGIINANSIFISFSIYNHEQYVDALRNLQTVWLIFLATCLLMSLGKGEFTRNLRRYTQKDSL